MLEHCSNFVLNGYVTLGLLCAGRRVALGTCIQALVTFFALVTEGQLGRLCQFGVI